jgi:hypothetical protein
MDDLKHLKLKTFNQVFSKAFFKQDLLPLQLYLTSIVKEME